MPSASASMGGNNDRLAVSLVGKPLRSKLGPRVGQRQAAIRLDGPGRVYRASDSGQTIQALSGLAKKANVTAVRSLSA